MIMDPLYMRVRRYLVRQVQLGQVGDKLPSENQLCKKFDVSRITIRSAMKDLIEDDILVPRQGVGIFISRKKTPRSCIAPKVIGVAMFDNRTVHLNYFASLFLAGALGKIRKLGWDASILQGLGVGRPLGEECIDLKLDGIVWLNPCLSEIRKVTETGVPIVGVGNIASKPRSNTDFFEFGIGQIPDDISYCLINLYEEGRIAASYFLDQGIDKALIINRHLEERDFYKGMLHTFKKHSINPEGRIKSLPWDSFDNKTIVSLAEQGFRGIYVGDSLASAVMERIDQEKQIKRKDLKIITRACCRHTMPEGSMDGFINCDLQGIANRSVEALQKIIESNDNKTIRRTLKPKMV